MSVQDTLKDAIVRKRCVRIFAEGRSREVCPHALGLKDGRPRMLAFQYSGGSASGLAGSGQWRTFFLSEIASATMIDGPWQGGSNIVAKSEASLDRIEFIAH